MVTMAWPATIIASRAVWLVPIDQAPPSLDLAFLISLDLCYWICCVTQTMLEAIAMHGNEWSWAQCVYIERLNISEATLRLHDDYGTISVNHVVGDA